MLLKKIWCFIVHHKKCRRCGWEVDDSYPGSELGP